MLALLSGILIGFILAIPPGPLGVMAMRLGISKGLRAGVYFSIGAGLVDIGFCYIALVATSAVISALGKFFTVHPLVFLIFQLICVVGLIFYGLSQFRKKSPEQISSEMAAADHPPGEKIIEKISHKRTKLSGPLLLGAGIAFANAANPAFLPSLTYLGVFVQRYHIINPRWYNFILFAIGFGSGSSLWFYVLVRLVLRLKEKMSDNFLVYIHRFAGVTLISFGIYLAWRVIAYTNWTNFAGIIFR